MQLDEYDEYTFSVGENLENLYQNVFNEIYPVIETQKIGVLSTVIHIILGQEKSQAEQICKHLKIDRNKLEDDLSISSDIIGLFIINPKEQTNFLKKNIITPVKEGVKNVRKNVGSKLESKEMQLYQIVLIGCLIVGVIACIAYLDNQKQKKSKSEQEKNELTQPPKPKVPKPAALCLVVPASVVKNIKPNYSIDISQIEKLIDNTLYFLCKTPEDADMIENLLDFREEQISNVSDQSEVYVRINIDDGTEIIGKPILLNIKRNLPKNQEFFVIELACLKYLSGSVLQNFNRN